VKYTVAIFAKKFCAEPRRAKWLKAGKKTVPFEYVLGRSAEWLEDAHQILRQLGTGEGEVVLSPYEAASLVEGLRIIVSNLGAMKATLTPPTTQPLH
jgi:hypothetical protein